ncbi:MAG: TolC family protein [Kiritimatiellaeota bacterium]|nr:TolC family protein [Kiritimatiellota bacterium]
MGRTEPVEIESPEDTLRRRLLLNQRLPRSGPASLGIHDLPANEYWVPARHLEGGRRPPPPWASAAGVFRPTLLQALQIGARNSRDFQAEKEQFFRTALRLDLERVDFRTIFAGLFSGKVAADLSGDEAVNSTTGSSEVSFSRLLKNGCEFTARIGLDLVRLLSQDRSSSMGLYTDASISVPLLRGAGRRIAAENLTQAERNVLYAVNRFERFKRTFAVRIATEYLGVLRRSQEVRNAAENYRRLIAARRRARRLADSGRLPEFQYDQAIQNELSARTRWIRARQSAERSLDSFKLLIGLPPDARIELDPGELDRLQVVAERVRRATPPGAMEKKVPPADAPVILREPTREGAGPLEMTPEKAVRLALDTRLDLKTAKAKVRDAERKLYVATDALRPELTLFGSAQAGSRRSRSQSDSPDTGIDPTHGNYAALLELDPGFERTAERIGYRESLIQIESAVRDVQGLEDQIKLDVRNDLRALLQARETLQIQLQAVDLARKRVRSTDLFLQAGRASVRDVLESQEALLSAQNAATAALVDYRIAELDLQRDIGVLEVDGEGLWREYTPAGK